MRSARWAAMKTPCGTLRWSEDCIGIICGHIHTPADKMIDGIHYLNSGDWVESLTAIGETYDGRFELIEFKAFQPDWIAP